MLLIYLYLLQLFVSDTIIIHNYILIVKLSFVQHVSQMFITARELICFCVVSGNRKQWPQFFSRISRVNSVTLMSLTCHTAMTCAKC